MDGWVSGWVSGCVEVPGGYKHDVKRGISCVLIVIVCEGRVWEGLGM